MNKKFKKISAVIIGGLLIAGAGFTIGAVTNPIVKEVPSEPKVIDLTSEQTLKAFNEGVSSVKIPEPNVKIVEKNNTIEDTTKIDAMQKFIEDNVDEDATIEYITFEVDAKIEAEAVTEAVTAEVAS
jgi:hypothetical protein